MINLLIALLLMSAYAVIEAYLDNRKIQAGKYVEHKLSALVRFLSAAGVSLAFEWSDLIGALFMASTMLIWFWILFDIILNRLRGLHWLYLGDNFLDQPWIPWYGKLEYALYFEGWYRKYIPIPQPIHFFLKLMLFAWSIGFYYQYAL